MGNTLSLYAPFIARLFGRAERKDAKQAGAFVDNLTRQMLKYPPEHQGLFPPQINAAKLAAAQAENLAYDRMKGAAQWLNTAGLFIRWAAALVAVLSYLSFG